LIWGCQTLTKYHCKIKNTNKGTELVLVFFILQGHLVNVWQPQIKRNRVCIFKLFLSIFYFCVDWKFKMGTILHILKHIFYWFLFRITRPWWTFTLLYYIYGSLSPFKWIKMLNITTNLILLLIIFL
jgi:hypothetical protein